MEHVLHVHVDAPAKLTLRSRTPTHGSISGRDCVNAEKEGVCSPQFGWMSGIRKKNEWFWHKLALPWQTKSSGGHIVH